MTLPPSCLIPPGLKRGDKGPGVRTLQEWLSLAGHLIAVDGDFGPATERALTAWRTTRWGGMSTAAAATPVRPVDASLLVEPMEYALDATGSIIDIARAHLKEHPREVGGKNRGPWCRLYSGDAGEGRAWCLDAVIAWAKQAGADTSLLSPSCDETARRAKAAGRLSTVPRVGDVFLRWTETVGRGGVMVRDWTHGGLVVEVGHDAVGTIETVSTIEGNGLPLGAPVLTPTGWRPIGDLRVGDRVCDPDGSTDSVVTGVYPQGEREVYDLRFTDGSSVIADGSHRWRFHAGKTRRAPQATMSTEEAMAVLATTKRLYLPTIRPVEFAPTGPMPLDPYLVGLLLGNGGMTEPSAVRFTTDDPDTLAALHERLPDGCVLKPVDRFTHRIIGPIHDHIRALGLAGKSSYEKSVPHAYKWANPAARVALLQGLMDTDGSVDRQGRMEFCTTSLQLAEDVQFLVQSLGGKVRICLKTGITFTSPSQASPKAARDAYVLRNIRFPPPAGIVPFRLDRKVERVSARAGLLMRGWGVESIKPAGRMETVCIAVSAPSRLYITEHFIPTHNTNDDGGREGIEVCARTRGISRLDFVRLG